MLTTDSSALMIQTLFILPFLLLGLSHIAQPTHWVTFFGHLHRLGPSGVFVRVLGMELLPATLILNYHLVWQGPAIILTFYGCGLMLKNISGLFVPQWGLRSMAMAATYGEAGFVKAGIGLILLAALCGYLAI